MSLKKIACLLFLLASCANTVFPQAFDHQAEATKLGCIYCHTDNSDKYVISSSASEWCVKCHPDSETMGHPTKIQATPSSRLPLDSEKKMNCLTCHSPHRQALATESWVPGSLDQLKNDEHPTYLLIKRNNNGELCKSCHSSGSPLPSGTPVHSKSFGKVREFVGSAKCMACHPEIFKLWKDSPHALMTRPPEKVLDFAKIPQDGFEWPQEKIKYVLGSHYVNRFIAEASGTLVVLPRIFDRKTKKWLTIQDYGWRKRFWLKQCAGCHVTGFTPGEDTFIEPGVGCEMCHGPGLNHSRTSGAAFIVNPAKLSAEKREMICMSCHTSGVDNSGVYSFPVGYNQGDDLSKYYSGLTPKPGQDSRNFFGDETFEDRVRQWEFLKSRLFLAKGLTCDYCQNFRNFSASGSEYLTHDQYCLTCHFDKTSHPTNSPSSNCTSCHAPTKTKSNTYSIHDHKFRF
ncbi:MAG: cytochrome c3 family protein [Candidatus Riflebacteria bacterium]|nr:cytochrome c3 family protein [Candidatus Riflebacteria bacterium]